MASRTREFGWKNENEECTDSGFNEDSSGQVANVPALQQRLEGLQLTQKVCYTRSPSSENNNLDSSQYNVSEGERKLKEQNVDGDTPLHLAILERDETNAHKIIDVVCGNDVLEIKNNYGLTPLILAVRMGMHNTVSFLLSKGVSIDCLDYKTMSNILHMVVESSDNLMLRVISYYLHDLAALANSTNEKGLTPFHLSTINKDMISCQLMAYLGADINVQDRHAGYTSLHHAVLTNDEKFVQDFIALFRPQLDVFSYAGLTPYELAVENGLDDIQRALLQAGAADACNTIS